jgi:DNA-binding transcriptional MerR regulator
MSLKMKKLIELTGESKSTILFYVKEGLLPQPEKPKANLHLYDETCVSIIKFIKYLQHQFSYSISQIKTVFKENNFNFDDDFSMMLKSLQVISGSLDGIWYSEAKFLEFTGLTKEELDNYIKRDILFKQEQGFTTKDLKIAKILKRAKGLGLNEKLFDEYVEVSKRVAKLEYNLSADILTKNDIKLNETYELIFSVILDLKPYIYNRHTIKEHKERMANKI